MALREHLHDRLDMLAIFSPVAPEVITALPGAVQSHLGTRLGEELHRTVGRNGSWNRTGVRAVERLAPTIVSAAAAPLGDAEQAMLMVDAGYPGLPLAILTSGDRITMMFPHDLFDGTAAWRHITQIMAIATDAETPTHTRPSLRFPVIAALRQSALLSRAALLSVRAIRRQAEVTTAVADQRPEGFQIDRFRRDHGYRSVLLTAEQCAHVESSISRAQAASSHRSARSTGTMKFAEIVLAAAAASFDERFDYRIRISIDLRRYVPRNTTVHGPFSTAFPIGLLRASDNSAPALSARLSHILSSRAPLAALVGDLVGLARLRVIHPFGRPDSDPVRRSFDLGLSILPSQLPESFWGRGRRESGAVLVHPTQATNPYIQLARVGEELVIGIWDEIGAIDFAAFEAELTSSLASRVSLSQTEETRS